mgnify:FL=1
MKKLYCKTITSFVLAIIMISQFSATCYAMESYNTASECISYVSNDEEHEMKIERVADSELIIDTYVDKEHLKESRFLRINAEQLLYTVNENGNTIQKIINIADYVTHISSNTVTPNAVGYYRGTIFYNPKIYNGVSYERTLGIWYNIVSQTQDGYTINGEIGNTIEFLVGILLQVLPLPIDDEVTAAIANFLIGIFAPEVVNGVVVQPFVETLNATNTEIDITSVDQLTGAEMYHSGEAHYIEARGRKDEVYVDGDLPFGDATIARRMFEAHWPNDWTGIQSFYSASSGV